MDTNIEKILSSLRSRHINGIFAEDYEEANQKILALIPLNATVGIGDSTSMRQLGILQALRERGTKILNPFEPKEENISVENFRQRRARVVKDATLSDVFLTGTNALTQDGKLVNVDATGNRVAGMFWGHPLSIIVVGRNKIVKNLDEALQRIRNIIAPSHFRIRTGELGGRKKETPCVVTGKCNDCRAVDRGCNIFTIIEGKPSQTDLNVILVNQDLGLGWDPSWPQERISKILDNYKKFVWVPV
jgi:L-lactate utilization protein LutB